MKILEELLEKCQDEFTPVGKGILESKSCRLLLINGLMDGYMPVDDSTLLAEHGRPKEFRFIQGEAHCTHG